MGGKSKGSNNASMMMEMQAANEARARDMARTARLNTGAAQINEIFEGRPVYEGGGYGWDNLPAGAWINGDRVIGAGGQDIGAFTGPGTGAKVIGREGGISEDFYNRFKQGALDYYKPAVEDQFSKAKDQLTYGAANAGTLRSSETGNQLADLVKQRQLADAQVNANVNTQVGNLKSTVQQNKTQALAQLYATEDPDIAANTAVQSVGNLNLTTPSLDPIGELFKPVAMGAAGFGAGMQSAPYSNVRYSGSSPGATSSGKSKFGINY